MAESFNYVKQLINAERYKDYEKDFWAGCEIVSNLVRNFDSEKSHISIMLR